MPCTASTTSTMPGGRWTSSPSACGCGTWRLCGEEFAFPANGYKGDYVREIAAELLQQAGQMLVRPEGQIFGNLPADEPEGGNKETYIDAVIGRARELIGDADFRDISQLALKIIIKDMEDDLREFGVVYDRWYSEASLSTNGAIDRALDRLRSQDHVYEKDGALWFRATAFGDEKDRVVVRENGVKTYFASDIAYHLDKRERGFEILLRHPGLGPPRLHRARRAGLAAMGEPADSSGSAAGAVRVAVSRAARRRPCPRAPASSSRCGSCAARWATTRRDSST
jgi:arginyl-tRNA synthetase